MYLQSTVSSNTAIIVNNSGLVKKVYFPYEILPLSTSIAGAINYLFCLIVLLAAMLYFGVEITIAVLSVIAVLVTLMIFALGLSLLLSAVNVYFRDTEHIVGVLFMAWFYLTPIFYPLSMVPEKYQHFFLFNPMTHFMDSFQKIFYYGEVPQPRQFLYCLLIAVITLAVGYLVFRILKRRFAEEL
jgi:ABC-2 type transport system permease protein